METNKVIFDLLPAATVEQILSKLDVIEKCLTHKPEPAPQQEEYKTRNQACEKLHITLPTLHTWIKQGKLKAYHIGGRTLLKDSELTQALEPVSYDLENKRR